MEPFLVALDSMIDSTLEFIADDEILSKPYDEPERLIDLGALMHVRKLYMEVFKEEEEDE